jgi:hypothetical protein
MFFASVVSFALFISAFTSSLCTFSNKARTTLDPPPANAGGGGRKL